MSRRFALAAISFAVALAAASGRLSSTGPSPAGPFPAQVPVRTGSAEDLVVFKACADRDKDWVDVEGVLIRQAKTLDWHYIRTHLTQLAELKDAPELVDKLERLRRSTEDGV